MVRKRLIANTRAMGRHTWECYSRRRSSRNPTFLFTLTRFDGLIGYFGYK
ncbi:MAG: hypothetical protein ACLFSH_05410 [Phormidium sp.]